MYLNFNKFAALCVSFLEKVGIITPLRLIRIKYFLKFRRSLSVRNPKNLNEKIIWLSFNTDTSAWTTLADKYEVRKYVQECGLEDLLLKLFGDTISDLLHYASVSQKVQNELIDAWIESNVIDEQFTAKGKNFQRTKALLKKLIHSAKEDVKDRFEEAFNGSA